MIKLKKGKRPRVQKKDTDFVFTSFQPDNEVNRVSFPIGNCK